MAHEGFAFSRHFLSPLNSLYIRAVPVMSTRRQNLSMEIYTRGMGVRTIKWADEQDYNAGRQYLLEIGALLTPDQPAFCYLKGPEQLELLSEFRKAQRESRRRARS